MKTIQAIVELASEACPGEVLAMATVMHVGGSAYRRPGARMLMTAAGRTVGMISGGCLENDARERAWEVIATGKPQLVTYDSTAPEDIVFGLGLGCNGIVQVLIEPLTVGDDTGLLAFLSACVARRQTGKVATAFASDDFPLGARALRWPDGSVTANCDAGARLRKAAAHHTAGVLMETIAPPVPLTIFGAGDDAIPVATLAKLLGWHVTVIDARPAFATPARFPDADAVFCLRPESLPASPQVVLPPESLVIVMTHHFTHDRTLLDTLLARPLRYLGVLGPKSRTQRLLDDLGADAPHLRAPAGLDIGAETPEEIAVSILGEMQAVLAQRSGGALRDRTAPIHDPVDRSVIVA